jgi:hypothetical protein
MSSAAVWREEVPLGDIRRRAAAASPRLVAVVRDALSAPPPPVLTAEDAQGLLTYRVPATGPEGSCARKLADAPFDLRPVLFGGDAPDWEAAAGHPTTVRLHRWVPRRGCGSGCGQLWRWAVPLVAGCGAVPLPYRV